jgi:general L-amino acid transport system permease protein
VIRRPALLRDERVLAILAQVLIAGLALGAFGLGLQRILADLGAKNLAPGLDFLSNTAGFGISEGIEYAEGADNYGRAFLVGLVNTLRVAIAGIVLATPLGVAIALGRLSGNPLLERLARGYVELMRNTPLLVQLIFWYQGVILNLPALAEAITVGGNRLAADGAGLTVSAPWLALSQRGVVLPRFVPQPGAVGLWAVVGLGAFAAWLLYRWRERVQARTGKPAFGLVFGLATWLTVIVVAWFAFGQPYGVELPAIGRFRYESGLVLSPEFSALLVGLVVYSAAFIAEVVRGGIQAISIGQREAARAVGLRETQLMRLVILPQALRVIVPPLTNQYLNLAKNSSLAIFVGFPDLFNVGLTIGNNTGQFVIVTAMMMAVYLAISLTTSLLMNLYNRRIRLVER